MPKSKGYGAQASSQREMLENALAALVRVEYLHPITRLRVRQARDRAGMSALLAPALEEMDDMRASVMVAKSQVSAALSRLIEG
jgi:hypothetical protein